MAIDNSASERPIRPIAVGQRNWLFAGSDTGGRTAAILFTLIRSAEHHQLDPVAYLCDLLRPLLDMDMPLSEIDELLAERWQPIQQ